MKPVLLLLPGMLNDARVWQGVAQHLADMAEIRMPDFTRQATLADMARDAWALVNDLPAQQPLLLAGFSMGGYVALEMLVHPARAVQGLALVDTSARAETPDSAAQRAKTIAAIERRFESVVEGLLSFCTHLASQGDAGLMQTMRQMMLAVGAEAAIRQNRAIAERADYREQLGALRLPVRVICGAHDRVTPPELARELAQLMAGAQLVLIEEAGHMTPMEQPTQVAAALRPLLQTS